jgi:SAM-dependent methyltransferase
MDDFDDPIKRHAKALFERLQNPWPENDRWSSHTQKSISNYIAEFTRDHQDSGPIRILNVGSHGNTYGLKANLHFHVDIAERSMRSVPLACVGDAECLPFAPEVFDWVLCVGSVINYCTAALSLSELARVLRPGGLLLLEFETSESPEFEGTMDYGKDVTIVRTFYNGVFEKIYVYSKKYIEGALAANDIIVTHCRRFHLASPFVYRYTRNERFAALFSSLDGAIAKFPMFRKRSANLFVAAHKRYNQS